ncbi:hypothetical protein GALMADRAFT_88601 [Galerina marginata CBS 339.88]|uniref:DNA polymerase n=1 Tax=Galerina marginata (strain CBS 339.88) TaxID=685588 RepID=A0A067TV36_GALM3|nr:hypothetical protein GALMADRAFT_88601 [Galerina marginata CBS 339.88]
MLGRYTLLPHRNVSRLRPAISHRLYSELKSQHNQAIVDMLLKHKQEEEDKASCNSFKVHAFSKAIFAVLQYKQPIRSGNDILQSIQLRGIGRGITARINEYLLMDETIAEKDANLYEEIRKSQIVTALNNIPGIGPTTAKKLVEAGCLSIEDLKSGRFSSMLSVKQLAKIKYADHLDHLVRGQEAGAVLAFCRESLDSQYEVTLVGEYRRGIPSFSEIRIMISHPDFVHVPLPTEQYPDTISLQKDVAKKRPRGRRKNEEKTNLLQTDIIPLLQQRGLIAETLSSSNFKSWDGIIRLPGQQEEWGARTERISAIDNTEGHFRKMTIHFVPQKSRGSSLICLTGDGDFEKDIVYRARQRGMLFNEYGIWKWTTHPPTGPEPNEPQAETPNVVADNAEAGFWSLVKSATEEDIFKELGMDFIDPTRRNFSYVSGKARKGKKRTARVEH